jgi:phytoene dehydrogenase-like protein
MSNQDSNENDVISRVDHGEKEQEEEEKDIVVIGAGVAGLTAAIILARAGRSVTVFEQSTEVGGRARTANVDGFYFNQGPHALYLSGAGARILRELGIKYTGNPPPLPQYLVKHGLKYQQAASFSSILTTKLLKGSGSRIELIRFFSSLNKTNFTNIQGITIQEWLKTKISHQDVFDLLIALCRVVTYANNPEIQSADATLFQLQMAISGGVIYLDGGWQTLVNGLVLEALKAKVRINIGKRVSNVKEAAIDASTSATMPLWRIYGSDGSSILTSTLIIGGSPADVQRLFRDNKTDFLSRVVGERRETNPVRAACLDIALSTLPNPNIPVALGVDSPLFLSVHSASARLAPKGGALIHVMKYLGSSHEPNPENDRLELEAFLDLIQPGWRDVVVRQRFLPSMVVYNAIVTARQEGTLGRPDTKVPKTENLYLVGDWVGPEGLLADASFASAKSAAEQILKLSPNSFSSTHSPIPYEIIRSTIN